MVKVPQKQRAVKTCSIWLLSLPALLCHRLLQDFHREAAQRDRPNTFDIYNSGSGRHQLDPEQ